MRYIPTRYKGYTSTVDIIRLNQILIPFDTHFAVNSTVFPPLLLSQLLFLFLILCHSCNVCNFSPPFSLSIQFSRLSLFRFNRVKAHLKHLLKHIQHRDMINISIFSENFTGYDKTSIMSFKENKFSLMATCLASLFSFPFNTPNFSFFFSFFWKLYVSI